ncbi:MAG TPA: VOC family protein [Kofleriaceae bacterium]
MPSRLNPYLSFKDTAREAMEFYKSVFGGKLTISTFKDFGASQDPSQDNLVMHSALEADNGILFMGSDTPPGMPYRPGASISMALGGDNVAELSGYFEKLSAGGKIGMPLAKAPWGDTFGSFTDKFGIEWLVNIAGSKP